ncbi:MAG: hypothetical protein L0Z49_13685 [Actinobacteria bacterium]|nr:hypothetical protein [Actinomycetota bacterium]
MLAEPACAEVGTDVILGGERPSAAEGAAADQILVYIHDHPGDIYGWYWSELDQTLVVVASPESFQALQTRLPADLRGPLQDVSFEVALQEGCFELGSLRHLREQIREDSVVKEALRELGLGAGLGFSIEAETGRLVVYLPAGIDQEAVQSHLMDRFGEDRLAFEVMALLTVP